MSDDRDSVWAQYTLRVQNRDEFRAQLQEKGIPTAVHYPVTMADQPAYKELVRCHDLTESRKAAEEVVSLPMYADMPAEDVEKTVQSILSLN